MSPWDVLFWVLAVALSAVIVAIALFVIVTVFRQLAHPQESNEPDGTTVLLTRKRGSN